MSRVRILLGDDHALILDAVRNLLASHYDVVGAVADGRALVDAAQRLQPDVIVLDVSMPLLNGLEAAKQIRKDVPGAKLVFLSMHSNPMYLRRALGLGAAAYLLKSGASEELLSALREVLAGRTYLTPEFAGMVSVAKTAVAEEAQDPGQLTGRQREILQLVAEGRQNKEIAHILGLSIKTVEFHRGRLMSKLGVRSTAELTRIAIEEGIVGP